MMSRTKYIFDLNGVSIAKHWHVAARYLPSVIALFISGLCYINGQFWQNIILCHPGNICISNMTWFKLILEVVILLANLSLKLYLIEMLCFLQILIQAPLSWMFMKYVNNFIVWGHKSWFLWVKIKITKHLIEFWEKLYTIYWAILAL